MPGVLQLRLLRTIQRRTRRPYVPKKRRECQDPFEVYTDKEFKRRFRMSKEGVSRLHDKLLEHLQYEDMRGRPLDAMKQLLIGLHFLGSTDLLRDTGDGLFVSVYSSWKCVGRVIDALLKLESEFVYYPNRQQMEATATFIYKEYGIKNLFVGVDGTHIRFPEKPRDYPPHHHWKQYTNRKNYFSINAMIVGNEERILHVDCGWPGSIHDGRIWNRSNIKEVVESQNRYCIVGDSGYAISEHMMKPFSTEELAAEGNELQRRKMKYFNKNLSDACT